MKTVELTELPDCDFCVRGICPSMSKQKARYDGPTQLGPWAYMCPSAMLEYGYLESNVAVRLEVE